MAINFPNSPTVNQVYKAAGRYYTWNGVKWICGGGPVSYATTYITSSSYTISLSDYYIGVNTTSPVTITLPSSVDDGSTYIVKDELGQASQGPNRYITILPSGSDLIDGEDRAILAFDFGSLTFTYRDDWRVV
jgi:hypothetical protein